MIELIPEGLTETAYYTIITGNTAKYKLLNVAAGTYVVKVSKRNHAPREYTITVAGTATQNVQLYLWGDADLNGTVNTADISALLQYLVGYPQPVYVPCDFNRSGTLTVADAVLLTRLLAE